jgi:zinc-finger of transposase IS204/IS1001/IS1096/IS1165
MIETGRGSRVS